MAKPSNGSPRSDLLSGTSGDDFLIGHAGDDVFYLSGGDDVVFGQGGFDAAVFAGQFSDFDIQTDHTGNLRTFVTGIGGNAQLKNVETLLFDNGI